MILLREITLEEAQAYRTLLENTFDIYILVSDTQINIHVNFFNSEDQLIIIEKLSTNYYECVRDGVMYAINNILNYDISQARANM